MKSVNDDSSNEYTTNPNLSYLILLSTYSPSKKLSDCKDTNKCSKFSLTVGSLTKEIQSTFSTSLFVITFNSSTMTPSFLP